MSKRNVALLFVKKRNYPLITLLRIQTRTKMDPNGFKPYIERNRFIIKKEIIRDKRSQINVASGNIQYHSKSTSINISNLPTSTSSHF